MVSQQMGAEQRFFQRGHTWVELLESWSADRDFFLGLYHNLEKLPKFHASLMHFEPQPIGVTYRPHLLFPLYALPAIGKTLAQAHHLRCHFFNAELFHSRLYASRSPLGLFLPGAKRRTLWEAGDHPQAPGREQLTGERLARFLVELDDALAREIREALS